MNSELVAANCAYTVYTCLTRWVSKMLTPWASVVPDIQDVHAEEVSFYYSYHYIHLHICFYSCWMLMYHELVNPWSAETGLL